MHEKTVEGFASGNPARTACFSTDVIIGKFTTRVQRFLLLCNQLAGGPKGSSRLTTKEQRLCHSSASPTLGNCTWLTPVEELQVAEMCCYWHHPACINAEGLNTCLQNPRCKDTTATRSGIGLPCCDKNWQDGFASAGKAIKALKQRCSMETDTAYDIADAAADHLAHTQWLATQEYTSVPEQVERVWASVASARWDFSTPHHASSQPSQHLSPTGQQPSIMIKISRQ